MTFADLYGTDLDTELGTADRTQRFTTVLRKRYVNEGQRVFNEQTSCFVKRAAMPLVDGVSEYNLEATVASVFVDENGDPDYLWPAQTSASFRRYTADTESWVEGPQLPFKSEEELNQTRPGWRAESDGVPDCWTLRRDGGRQWLVVVPGPALPATEGWEVWFPYVARPTDMTSDAEVPYSVVVGGLGPTTYVLRELAPYHRALVHYAAAQLEKLRKNWEGVERQMRLFAAQVVKYTADQAPKRGTSIRLRQDYRTRLRTGVPLRFLDPTRYP